MVDRTLEDFSVQASSQDTRTRLAVYNGLVEHLSQDDCSLYCDDFDKFVDSLVQWINCSNYKISMNGLEVVCLLIDRQGGKFKIHITSVLPSTIDRLGDAKQSVRDLAQITIMKLMSPASTPLYIMERMGNAFTHKLWRVRQETCFVLQKALELYGASSLSLSKVVPVIVGLFEDSNIPVRDAAVATVVCIYRHVGEKVRADLQRRNLNSQRLKQVLELMDEARDNGQVLVKDELDGGYFVRPAIPPPHQAVSKSATSGGASVVSASSHGRRKPTPSTSSQSATGKGGMDQQSFIDSYEDVPKLQIYSARDLNEHMTAIISILGNSSEAWEKRLKSIRSLMVSGAHNYDDFLALLRRLEPALQLSIKDLRSQVVREACISASYLSKVLGSKFDHCGESILPMLVILIQNSAKIMSSSAMVALKLIIQETHNARYIPLITANLTSKSAIIRRECCGLMADMVKTWPFSVLDKYRSNLKDSITRVISDPDTNTRMHARLAYLSFSEHFKNEADQIFNSLDLGRQKTISGTLSHASSSSSLNSNASHLTSSNVGGGHRSRPASRPTPVSNIRSASSDRIGLYGRTATKRIPMSRDPSLNRDVVDTPSPRIPISRRKLTRSNSDANIAKRSTSSLASRITTPSRVVLPSRVATPSRRSPASSAVGSCNSAASSTSAAVLVNNGSTPSQVVQAFGSSYVPKSGLYLSQPNKTTPSPRMQPKAGTPGSDPRSRGRPRMSQSQPGSRSTSPSSRYNYLTSIRTESRLPGPVNGSPGTPNSRQRTALKSASQCSSRETSPRRFGRERRYSSSSNGRVRNSPRLNHNTMNAGGDMERVIANALTSNRRRLDDSDDNISDASSLCSDRGHLGAGGDYIGGGGKMADDLMAVTTNMASANWMDRKDGLLMLSSCLQHGRILNRTELRRVTEIFTKMFHDPHGKVFSIYLDTLCELVQSHSDDLQFWMYACLTRLLAKIGADVFGSTHAKLMNTLDIVRQCFPVQMQFTILIKFTIDKTQSPSIKVKLALMSHLHSVILLLNACDMVNSSDVRLAVSRYTTWTSDTKSFDVRKASQNLLIALFSINPGEFSSMIQDLPKNFQVPLTSILRNYLQAKKAMKVDDHSASVYRQGPPVGVGSVPVGVAAGVAANYSTNSLPHLGTSAQRIRYNSSNSDTHSSNSQHQPHQQPQYQPHNQSHENHYQRDEMNSEDIYNSFKKTSAEIQKLSQFSDNLGTGVLIRRESASQDSGIQELRISPDIPNGGKTRSGYSPDNYTDGFKMTDMAHELNSIHTKDTYNEPDILEHINSELSHRNTRDEERRVALQNLIQYVAGNKPMSDIDFKSTLLQLFQTLTDDSAVLRGLTLKTLTEMLKYRGEMFKNYAELLTLKVVNAYKDTAKEVIRVLDACAAMTVKAFPGDQLSLILVHILHKYDFPMSQAAIKMLTQVIENTNSNCDFLKDNLGNTVKALLEKYEHVESSTRKATVFCLVALYRKVGSSHIEPHLIELSGSKRKLLNLYLERAHDR